MIQSPLADDRVWLFTMSWNEERVLPFFFRHYDPWVDRYVVYDDGSTDATLAMFAAHPRVEVRRFERVVPDSFVLSNRILFDNVWKEVRGIAAWAVVTAIDEHLHHPDITGYLRQCRAAGVSAIPALGFQMLSDTFPPASEWLAETRRLGMPHYEMCKLSILDPNLLDETRYSPGRHFAEPLGRVVYPEADELVNLHYKHLGRDETFIRHRKLAGGLGPRDIADGMGAHWGFSRAQFEERWQQWAAEAMDYRDPRVGFTTHVERWWRGPRRRG